MGDDLTEADFNAARIDEVRAAVKDLQQREGLSNSAVARETNIGPSTLAAFMTGTYRGNMAAQALVLQRWLTARSTGALVRQQATRGPGYVRTRTADSIIALLEHSQFSPDFALLVGEPGLGKTTVAKEYARLGHNVYHLTAQPTAGTPGQVVSDIADALAPSQGGFVIAGRQAKQIVKRLKDTQSLIIYDEAQNLSSPAMDQLRAFHDLADCGVVLMGNRSIIRRVEGGARASDFAQLYSRVGMRLNKSKPYVEDVEALLDGWGIEDRAVRRIARAVARRPGALRSMTKVLRQAHLRANAGDGVVTEALMLAAVRQLGDERPLEMGDEA